MQTPNLLCKTRQQIAGEYGISTRTLNRWLAKHRINIPYRLIRPEEQFAIYSLIGWPDGVEREQFRRHRRKADPAPAKRLP